MSVLLHQYQSVWIIQFSNKKGRKIWQLTIKCPSRVEIELQTILSQATIIGPLQICHSSLDFRWQSRKFCGSRWVASQNGFHRNAHKPHYSECFWCLSLTWTSCDTIGPMCSRVFTDGRGSPFTRAVLSESDCLRPNSHSLIQLQC